MLITDQRANFSATGESRLPPHVKTNLQAKLPTTSDAQAAKKPGRNKYSNKWTQVDGHNFQSEAEADRYTQLILLVGAGVISDLKLQPRFEIWPAYTDSDGRKVQKAEYVADFRYVEKGRTVVEDVKGVRTKLFELKWKMFRKLFPELCGRLITKGT